MKRITKALREFLTRTAALVSMFGVLFHPAGFYRLERVHALPPNAQPTATGRGGDGNDATNEDGDGPSSRRRKTDRWIDDRDGFSDTDNDDVDSTKSKELFADLLDEQQVVM